MTFKKKVQENPVISTMLGFILLAGTATGTISAVTGIDALVMTQAEHDADFIPLSNKVDGVDAWNKCERLERRIETLEDRKWKRQQAAAGAEAIRDIEKDITEELRKYGALKCATILK